MTQNKQALQHQQAYYQQCLANTHNVSLNEEDKHRLQQEYEAKLNEIGEQLREFDQ